LYSHNLGRSEGIELVPAGGPNGDPDGNDFTNLGEVVVPPCNYLASTNYLDVGGATNLPARYYRVWLRP
jgi:hypothetical protein